MHRDGGCNGMSGQQWPGFRFSFQPAVARSEPQISRPLTQLAVARFLAVKPLSISIYCDWNDQDKQNVTNSSTHRIHRVSSNFLVFTNMYCCSHYRSEQKRPPPPEKRKKAKKLKKFLRWGTHFSCLRRFNLLFDCIMDWARLNPNINKSKRKKT